MKTLLLLPALGLALLAQAAGPAVEIKLATILPAGTSGHQRLMELRESWQKASGQSVKLTVYAGSADGEALLVKKMRAGQIHAALVSAVGLADIDRAVTSLQLMPLTFQDWAEVDYVREKIRANLEDRLRAKGFEVLFWADAGWVRFFSKAPAAHPDDLKAMKLFAWAGDPHTMRIMRSLGYQPLGLEVEQILPGFSTGMINAAPVPPFIANALQYNRYAGHMLDVRWVPIVGAAVVRRDTWEKIPAELRAALMKSAEATGHNIRARCREEDDAAIAAMQKRGLVVQPLNPQLAGEWAALAQQVYPLIRGTVVPADIFDLVHSHVAEYRSSRVAVKP